MTRTLGLRASVATARHVNVGIDVEAIARFARADDDPAWQQLFTDEERAACPSGADAAAYYAGTWCAKEAAVKALWPWTRLDPRRVNVWLDTDGRSRIRFDDVGSDAGRVMTELHVAYAETIAVAWVVARGDDPTPMPTTRP
jgi:phosphopantetheine--protein transferase-like protein